MTDKQKRDELIEKHAVYDNDYNQYVGVDCPAALTEYDAWHIKKIIEVIEREFPAQGDDIDSAILAIKDIIRTAGKEKV